MIEFCLVLCFPSRNRHCIVVSVATSPYTLIQSPHSWSPPLCRLVLWNWVLEPLLWFASFILAIIRLRVYPFLLVFFDSLAGKAFFARSIKLCLVDNQQSSGVAVAGFESCWFEAGLSTSRSPPIERTLTSRKIGPTPHHSLLTPRSRSLLHGQNNIC